MLYKFKSKASADLIMLEPNGRQILQIIGKDAVPQGIILPEQMLAAAVALEAAAAQNEVERQHAIDEAQALGHAVALSDAISLRKRAGPFIDMLRSCQAQSESIVWGV